MNKVIKDAQKDAKEYMAAQMFYGEGAGIRRKHITHAVAFKTDRFPGYDQAFNTAVRTMDPEKFIKSARRERKTKDISAYTSRNIKALARGDRHGMSGTIIAISIVAGVAHTTGYDKIIWKKTKAKTEQARVWLKRNL